MADLQSRGSEHEVKTESERNTSTARGRESYQWHTPVCFRLASATRVLETPQNEHRSRNLRHSYSVKPVCTVLSADHAFMYIRSCWRPKGPLFQVSLKNPFDATDRAIAHAKDGSALRACVCWLVTFTCDLWSEPNQATLQHPLHW